MLGQTILQVSFRDFEPSDYERLAEINNRNYPDYPNSVEELRHSDESIDKTKHYRKRLVCLAGEPATVVGFGLVTHSWWNFHPQKFFIDLMVDPDHQHRGIGSQIFDRISADLRQLHATTAWAWVLENKPGSLAFAEKRGFVETRRMWESRLNPQEFDAGRFSQYLDGFEKDGMKVTTLTEEMKKGPQALREIYELDQDCWLDVPFPVPYTRISYEQWEAKMLKGPTVLPDGYFIASQDGRYAGYSNVWRVDKEPRSLFQWMTGVRREYRGRGVAIALKLRVIDYARRNGYDKILTTNDSENAPMLAINTKLGFKRQIGWITLEKNLA